MINPGTTQKATVGMKILTDDQIQEIIQAAYELVEKMGCKVLHAGAREMLKKAGAIVKDESVRIPEYIVKHCLNQAPKGFTVYDRLGNKAMEVKGRKSYFGTSTASPNTKDAETGLVHPTTVKDIGLGAKVADALENIDWVMPMGSSQDVPALAADVHEFEAVVANTTKPMVFIGYTSRGMELVFEMAAAVAGGLDKLQQKPFAISYPEPISPFVYPEEVVDRILISADLFMPQIPGSTIQLGGTAPVTLAGAVAQATAEAMISVTIAQLRRPGCPIGLSTNFGILDMSTGRMNIADPVMSLALCAHAEVAQSFGLPTWGLAGATDSKAVDAQSAAESTLAIVTQALAGLNLIHDVGYMDSGMVCSTDQLVMGNEVIGMARRFIGGFTVDSYSLATEVIAKVGPGGHFLAQRHTLDNFRTELWRPGWTNHQTRDSWERDGAKETSQIMREKVAEILETHQPVPLDDKVAAEVERIKKQGEKELLAKA